MSLLERRIGLLFAAFLALLAVGGLRALELGTIKGPGLARAATTQQVADDVVPARRGTITDRKGIELAVSEPADDVSATPYLVKDPAGAATRLAPLLGQTPDHLLRLLTRRDTGFVYLTRELPAARADRVSRLHLAGIDLWPTEKRVYPRGYMASQVLGSVGTDGTGLSGIEYSRERLLHGSPGKRKVVKDALGQTLSTTDTTPARPGDRIELTLDSAIQAEAEQVLQQVGATYRPKGATAIVMDPRDNEILAMANWPRVDANDPGAAPAALDATENRATGMTYEPGSTFKAFTIAGALQDKVVTPDTEFTLPPQIQVADRTIGEAESRGTIQLSTAGILAQSSNVGAIKIGLEEGRARFAAWTRRFGFGTPTGVDLPGEEQGLILPLDRYSGSSMGNLPIGQGQAVTPMQITTAYSAIANGGILRPPRITRRIGGRLVPRPRGRRVISRQTAAQLRGMLKGVLRAGGTAQDVVIKGYQLAGKTGTANKIDPVTHQYSKGSYVASFVGFAPADDPRLLISVIVDEPHGDIYGGSVAAPAFGKIASFALPYLRIAPR